MVVVLFSVSAFAELGGTADSVKADQQRVQGVLRVSQTQAYAMHEIRTPNNGLIHEFISPAGKVFAVTYQGPFPGEANGLLGSYAPQIEQARKAATGQRHVGGTVHVAAPGLVYHAAGHMRYFSMKAYVPDAIPQGVAMEEIR